MWKLFSFLDHSPLSFCMHFRYGRYMLQKLGTVAALIVEQVMKEGSATASQIITIHACDPSGNLASYQ